MSPVRLREVGRELPAARELGTGVQDGAAVALAPGAWQQAHVHAVWQGTTMMMTAPIYSIAGLPSKLVSGQNPRATAKSASVVSYRWRSASRAGSGMGICSCMLNRRRDRCFRSTLRGHWRH